MINSFSNPTDFANQVNNSSKWLAVLALASFVVAFFNNFLLSFVARKQAARIRLLYFKSILNQDLAWFDETPTGTLISSLSENIHKIQVGIGSKLGHFIQYMCTFTSGIIIGFVYNWKLTLVALATLPAIVLGIGIFGAIMMIFTKKESEAYAKASSVAGEVLSAIRTVVAFGNQNKEVNRYSSELEGARKVGVKKAMAVNGSLGMISFFIFSAIALMFWYGVKLMIDDSIAPGNILIVVFGVIMGSISMGAALPLVQNFMEAKQAAFVIYQVINRKPVINKTVGGLKPDTINGDIEFRNVSFKYPTRMDVEIMKDFNLKIESGSTVAFVGPSGSGKSTCVQLMQRFYDPLEGEIILDEDDLRHYDIPHLRSHIGVVGQEPVLFAGTISENIKMGKLDASQEEIESASRMAFAHEFILEQPNGYDTWLGEGGGGLSGGQKQRIAIARALIGNPKILLLDEATSALDNRSEKMVQKALDEACLGRTVLMVAHRLTTVRKADKIVVISSGKIVEQGNHDELIALEGVYFNMLHKVVSYVITI
ncbi:hypothetical protein Ciccas_013172 [Cichlidogyrus casuarinus]|uniref:Uncharacterized protein n=1 Tax=Cichlidogyrus casuarinus TaxID=1844966 RepID=A0ABD2PMR2_9PLAT